MRNEANLEKMVLTVLEAHAASEQWDALRQIYADAFSHLPPQMVQTFLVQDSADPT